MCEFICNFGGIVGIFSIKGILSKVIYDLAVFAKLARSYTITASSL